MQLQQVTIPQWPNLNVILLGARSRIKYLFMQNLYNSNCNILNASKKTIIKLKMINLFLDYEKKHAILIQI